MNKIIIYTLVSIAGILLTITAYLKQDFNIPTQSNNNNKDDVILVDGEIPPQLSDLFPDQEDGPHQKFVDEKSCLKCHKSEIAIPGIGLVPKIPHEFRPDCVSCHALPTPEV